MRYAGCYLIATLALVALGCGGDKGTNPGPGNGDVVILSLDPEQWTTDFSHDSRVWDGSNCSGGQSYPQITNLADLLVDGAIRLSVTGNRQGGTRTCCIDEDYQGSIVSASRIDFTRFHSARLTGILALTTNAFSPGAECRVTIESNVPGSGSLQVAHEVFGHNNPVGERPFDISLQNALGFSEATVTVELSIAAGCSQTPYSQTPATFEIRDLRIVGKR